MKIIDCHANVGWDTSNLRKNYFPAEQKYQTLLKKMSENMISKAIILPFPSPGGQFEKNMYWYEVENHYLIQASRYSDKFIVFPAVNPNDMKSVKSIITYCNAYQIKGIKISHHIPMKFSVEKLINHPLMKIIKKNKLVVLIHTGTGKEKGSENYHETLDYGIKVAKRYPEVKFIFCHLGRLSKDILEALELENVYMDTSAVSMLSFSKEFISLNPHIPYKNLAPNKIIKDLVDLGYEDKLIFGSDEPYVFYKEELDAINEAEISESAKEKIFYKNITELINIKEEGKTIDLNKNHQIS
jgi:predicted TIM-barrel fold metal-dependent hydrolase